MEDQFGAEFIKFYGNEFVGALQKTMDEWSSQTHWCVLKDCGDHWGLTIVARDYPGLFSVLCGVLAQEGLHITEARIFTSNWGVVHPAMAKQSFAVDYFALERRLGDEVHDLQESLDTQFSVYIALLLQNRLSQLRQALHTRISLRLALDEDEQPPEGALLPPDIRFGEEFPYTVIHVSGHDTPAFLFSLSNVLTTHGALIYQVHFKRNAQELQMELYITDRSGRPFPQVRMERIQAAIVLVKQFSAHLPWAPDPALAVQQFYLFLDKIMDETSDQIDVFSRSGEDLLSVLARIFGSGTYLWEEFAKLHFDSLRGFLGNVEQLRDFKSSGEIGAEIRMELAQCSNFEEQIKAVNAYKDQMLFRVDLAHQAFPGYSFADFSKQVGVLAEVVLETLMQLCFYRMVERYGHPGIDVMEGNRWALFALGKFGGQELGYASDLELIFVYDVKYDSPKCKLSSSEFYEKMILLFQKSVWAKREGIFELDMRLRPYGDSGAMAVSLGAWRKYYEGEACLDYEKQALVKMRGVAGDFSLCWELERLRDAILYREQAVDVAAFFALRQKQMDHLAEGVLYNAKFSAGGLVDIEYSIQLLQRMYGYKYPELRQVNTRKAMLALLERDLLTPGSFEKLYNAYGWFRRLINNLRIVRGHAKDLEIPPKESPEFSFLARRMGMVPNRELSAEDRLLNEMHKHFHNVDVYVQNHFDRQSSQLSMPKTFYGLAEVLEGSLSDEKALLVLEEMRFEDTQLVYNRLRQFYQENVGSGLALSVVVLAQEFIRESPDPDLSVLHFLDYLHLVAHKEDLLERLFFHPEYLEILFSVFGGSDFLTSVLRTNPGYILELLYSGRLHKQISRWHYIEDMQGLSMEAVREYRNQELLRIALRDMHLKVSFEETVLSISDLSDAVINTVLRMVFAKREQMQLLGNQAVIAMGKLGGRELNYSSDIDLVFVYFGNNLEQHRTQLERCYRDFTRELTLQTAHGQLFRVDLNLRPYGGQGAVVHHEESAYKYYCEKADGWELQAWLKARVVGGAGEAEGLIQKIRQLSVTPPHSHLVFPSISHLRQLVLQRLKEKQQTDWEVKNGPGGIRTIEFLVQKLQLAHAQKYPILFSGNTLTALHRLAELDLIAQPQADTLYKQYVFLRTVEHRLQLFGMQQLHLVSQNRKEQAQLARRLGYISKVGKSARRQFIEDWQSIRNAVELMHKQLFE